MGNPTLHDVARAAGVSYSTADRVLNGRGGVAVKSIERVRQAIEDLGYRRDMTAANLSRRRSYRFAACVPQGDHGFFSSIRRAFLAEAEARAGQRVTIDLFDGPAASLPDDCDCAVVVGAGMDRLAPVMSRLAAGNVPVVALVSDIPGPRRAYIGIDNIVAGRTAGRLHRIAHRGRAARVLPVLGSAALRDHSDRLAGVAQALGRGALLPPIEVEDCAERMRDLLGRALRDDPQITGIYSIGAGNRGLIPLMRSLGSSRPFVVMHELTPHSRAALQDDLIDVVIDQKPAEEVASALDAMKAIADGETPPGVTITPAIFFKENLPGDPA
jgi:LacI family transcriptional regulator